MVGHATELSEEGVPQWWCCFETECESVLSVVQGLGYARVETPQTDGDSVQIGNYKSVPSLSCGP